MSYSTQEGLLDRVQRIAIVGGGPTGIACAKYLLAEQAFAAIDVFEQRDNVGGIWNLSDPEISSHISVPQTNPRYGISKTCEGPTTSLEFESPLYDYLETNIPKPLMAYSDTPFDTSLPLFPGHADVLKYLEEYSEPVRHLIHFHTQVVHLRPEPLTGTTQPLDCKWKLTTKSLSSGDVTQRQYDAVIVANGHYTIPHVPAVRGLAGWHCRYPGSVIHSKAYRRPEDFTGKKVLVIGNSASGLDIAAQLATCAQNPVYLASRSASQLAPRGNGPAWREDIAEINEFLDSRFDRAVRTKTGDIFDRFDSVIFATGYFYSFPFIASEVNASTPGSNTESSSNSTESSDSDNDSCARQTKAEAHTAPLSPATASLARLTTSGLRTHDVYKHFLHIDYPTLAFPVLNLKVIPFPLAENQAAVLARLWSGRLKLPSQTVMRAWQEEEEERLMKANRLRPAPDTASGEVVTSEQNVETSKGLSYEGGFHVLVYPEDANQINTLYDWAASAQLGKGLGNEGNGKLGTRWNEERVWLRGQFPDIKAAYGRRGADRTKVQSLDMLGEEWKHGFDKWKQTTSREDQETLFRKAAVPGW